MDQRFEIEQITFNGGSGYRQVGVNGVKEITEWPIYDASSPLSYRVEFESGEVERIFGVYIVNYTPVENREELVGRLKYLEDAMAVLDMIEKIEPQAVLDEICTACHGFGMYKFGRNKEPQLCHICKGSGRIKN